MESQPQNPEFRINPENFMHVFCIISQCQTAIGASIQDFDTYCISEQQRLWWNCESAQSCQSPCFSHTESMEAEECSEQN